ncbi:histidine kinase [Pseudoduganella flava]|uniref:Histidine kinase n=1 Tax=Pseudoduganella flava TaxID=871742 RepID=A0A562Q4L9_9BURK|nr:histidine kinase [Pseudoduganella flava]QGZ41694.1 sensor histidine kinase [Pseudoduganella flava]TWI51689.1 histidine kinase [Pseudoduganella flava]
MNIAHTGQGHAARALARIAGCTRRELAVSAALIALPLAAAWVRGVPAWLPLFAVLLAAWLGGAACLRLLRSAMPAGAGWWWAWLALVPAVALGACAAWWLYRSAALAALLGTPVALDDERLLAIAGAFCALAFGVPLFQAQRQAEALLLAELKHAALQAQLKTLQAQVEPHFLFNTLANTRYLARHAPEQAVRMLDHLIAYLRAALPDLRTASSTLGRECELAEHYLALMSIRFGDRLVTQVECPAGLRDVAMPPLMLMSLVENAVRHGVEPKPGIVHVRVTASADGGRLRVLVADDGAGLDGTVLGSGVGLRNVRERLAALYGANGGMVLRGGAQGWTEAELTLPLQREHHG